MRAYFDLMMTARLAVRPTVATVLMRESVSAAAKPKLPLPQMPMTPMRSRSTNDFVPRKSTAALKSSINASRCPGSAAGRHSRACKTGSPTSCPFEYAGPLAEVVQLGLVAYRVGQRIEWDAANLRAKNCPEVDRFIRPEYRKGWEL